MGGEGFQWGEAERDNSRGGAAIHELASPIYNGDNVE